MARLQAATVAVLAAVLVLFGQCNLAAAQSDTSNGPEIIGLSHGVHQDRVRLMFDVTEEPVFATFTLTEPDRLVIDFPSMGWTLDPAEAAQVPYIGALRYGLFRVDRARMVIELTEPVGIERILTQAPRGSEPGRLILDLSPISREEFDHRAGAPEQARWRDDDPARTPPKTGDIVVAIDPGHGGVDPGASHGRLTEKKVVLAFAEILAAEINARPGYSAVLTRDKDVFVPLAERVARAHRANANVMISVHADSLAAGRASGMSAYTLSERGSDLAAEALAARENRADVLAGADLGGESDDLTRLLVELAQRGTGDESGKLANAILGALRGNLQLLRTRPLRQANFRVLKAPDIPSVLLELGFLDSPKDRKRLSDPEWRASAARLVADGISNWRKIASPGFVQPH